MDFRFKYRRTKSSLPEVKREQREQSEVVRRMRGLAVGVSIPMSMVAGPVAGWLIGSWLDQRFGTAYWLPVLILVGTAAGIMMVIEMLVKLGRSQ